MFVLKKSCYIFVKFNFENYFDPDHLQIRYGYIKCIFNVDDDDNDNLISRGQQFGTQSPVYNDWHENRH